jgi:hypothetical protein
MLLLGTVNKLVIAKRIFKDKTSNKNLGPLDFDEKGISGIALSAK